MTKRMRVRPRLDTRRTIDQARTIGDIVNGGDMPDLKRLSRFIMRRLALQAMDAEDVVASFAT